MNSGDHKPGRARNIGAILQGLILGALLAVALVEMWAESGDVRVFRYQNF